MSNSISLSENITMPLTEKRKTKITPFASVLTRHHHLRVVKLEPNSKLFSSIDLVINDAFIKKIMEFKNKMKSKKKIM